MQENRSETRTDSGLHQLQATPPAVVLDGQVTAFGRFSEPFRELGIEQARILGGLPLPQRLLAGLRLKQWQHFAVFGPDLLLAFVVLDAGYMGTSFCYAVDRADGMRAEHHREGLPGTSRVGANLWNDDSRFRLGGHRISVRNCFDEAKVEASVDIAARGGVPAIAADLAFRADLRQMLPLEVVLPLGPNRPAWSRKFACPATGEVRVGDRRYRLDPEQHLVIADFHKAWYPYHMRWDWATCAGFDRDGRIIGLNLTHNVVRDDERFNENGLWVGDRLSLFGAARFDFDEAELLAPWRIATTDGRVRLDFEPIGKRDGQINMGILMSDYTQPYGVFRGEAVDDAGTVHRIDDLFGVTERHRARF